MISPSLQSGYVHPAYANNERIFSRFETNFRNGRSDGEDSFGETARKFATWLGVDRAYYEQGRPSVSIEDCTFLLLISLTITGSSIRRL